MLFKEKIKNTLPAFRFRNFRLFWSGQFISLIGTHMQTVALSWLVLRLTNKPSYMGYLNALATMPILFLSLFAGMIADRFNKRRILLTTQVALLIQATILAFMVWSGHIAIWALMALAMMQGTIMAFEATTRQSFVSEMVPNENVLSAVTLNSTIFNGTRIIGPAIAGHLIHSLGEFGCFFINAVSFLPVIAGIMLMREKDLFKGEAREKKSPMSELKEGFRYVAGEKQVAGLLGLIIVTSVLGMPAMVLLPVFARDVLVIGPKGMGYLFAAAGCGAVLSVVSLTLMKSVRREGRTIVFSSLLFTVSVIVFSQSKSYLLSMIIISFAGASITAALALTNISLQTIAPQHFRGRVMGMYILVLIGMTPPGSLLIGGLTQLFGPRNAVVFSNIACFICIITVSMLFPAVFRIDSKSVDKRR